MFIKVKYEYTHVQPFPILIDDNIKTQERNKGASIYYLIGYK